VEGGGAGRKKKNFSLGGGPPGAWFFFLGKCWKPTKKKTTPGVQKTLTNVVGKKQPGDGKFKNIPALFSFKNFVWILVCFFPGRNSFVTSNKQNPPRFSTQNFWGTWLDARAWGKGEKNPTDRLPQNFFSVLWGTKNTKKLSRGDRGGGFGSVLVCFEPGTFSQDFQNKGGGGGGGLA